MEVGQVSFKDFKKVHPISPSSQAPAKPPLGPTRPRPTARKPNREPPQQNQGGEEARLQTRAGRPPKGAA